MKEINATLEQPNDDGKEEQDGGERGERGQSPEVT